MAEPAITQDEQRLKQRAMRRLAIALTLIAVAIVGLALLDRYNASLKKPVPPAAGPPEAPAPLTAPPAPQSTPPPSAAQAPPKPPPPVVENPQLPAEQPSPSASAESAGKKPAPKATDKLTLPAQPSSEKPGVAPVERSAPSAADHKAAPAAPAKPSSSTPQTPAAATPAPAEAAAAPGKGFIVQVGVFMSASNARTLQSKLAEKGIPTHTETRVVVGPFKDRADAEAVIRQLKELGVEGVVVGPPAAP